LATLALLPQPESTSFVGFDLIGTRKQSYYVNISATQVAGWRLADADLAGHVVPEEASSGERA
jgi:hypothetical protein